MFLYSDQSTDVALRILDEFGRGAAEIRAFARMIASIG